jgi:UTP--glucose-1-phosphate uridylyltransferase
MPLPVPWKRRPGDGTGNRAQAFVEQEELPTEQRMTTILNTVIIPAAGQGTRLLPLTKVVPKELLPVHDRPVLQLALDEAVAAGASRIVIVIHESKAIIRQYLRRDPSQLADLREKGKYDLVDALASVGVPEHIDVVFAMQDTPRGLGHAVLCAAPFLLPGPVGVILPDDVIIGRPCLSQMALAYPGGHLVAAMDVSPRETNLYGIFKPGGLPNGRLIPVTGMIEKPRQGLAPSTLAAVGRYILDPFIMETLNTTPVGRGGEIQLTDAIAQDAQHLALTAFRFAGARFDCGTFDGLCAASVAQKAKCKADAILVSGPPSWTKAVDRRLAAAAGYSVPACGESM